MAQTESNTTNSVHALESFEFDNVNYSDPKKNKGHYFVCASDASENSKLYFQTPKLKMNSDLLNEQNNVNNFVDVICESDTFLNAVKKLDEHVSNIIKARRSEWFPNKNIDDTFLEVGQTHSIMKNDIMRLSVNNDIQIFDYKRENVSANTIVKDTVVKCILQFVGIWFTATRWGVTWKIVQMKTYPNRRRTIRYGYMFPTDDDDDGIDEDSIPIPPPGV